MNNQVAYFNDEKRWHKAIAAAVEAGLTFKAWDWGMYAHTYAIEYLGGY